MGDKAKEKARKKRIYLSFPNGICLFSLLEWHNGELVQVETREYQRVACRSPKDPRLILGVPGRLVLTCVAEVMDLHILSCFELSTHRIIISCH